MASAVPSRLEALSRATAAVLMDGAMGTTLQGRGLPEGTPPDLWNVNNPAAVEQVHREYIAAGARVLLTNTFGASAARLAAYGNAERCTVINEAAVALARAAAGSRAAVLGNLGPTGTHTTRLAEFSDKARADRYIEQVEALAGAGVDGFLVETMLDGRELVAALTAIRQVAPERPVLALGTFLASLSGAGDSVGLDPERFASLATLHGAWAIGANCTQMPEPLGRAMYIMGQTSPRARCARPSAGLPDGVGPTREYPLSPTAWARLVAAEVRHGVRWVGGCCGTTPEHIRILASLIEQLPAAPETTFDALPGSDPDPEPPAAAPPRPRARATRTTKHPGKSSSKPPARR